MSATVAEVTATKKKVIVPLIIDMGKVRPKKIKQLKKGKGPYLDEVMPAIDQVKAELGTEMGNGRDVLPVIVLYEKKAKKIKAPTLNLLGL